MVNRIWPIAVVGAANCVSSVLASACHRRATFCQPWPNSVGLRFGFGLHLLLAFLAIAFFSNSYPSILKIKSIVLLIAFWFRDVSIHVKVCPSWFLRGGFWPFWLFVDERKRGTLLGKQIETKNEKENSTSKALLKIHQEQHSVIVGNEIIVS